MSARNLVLSSAFLLPLLTATPAAAQRVEADIRIGGGPVSGRVIIGDRRDRYDDYYYRPRHAGRVEWIRVRDRGFNHGWFKKFRREARVIVVYYDRRDGYYDQYRRGYDRVRLYECGGRFYRMDDDNYFDRYDDRDGRRDDWYDDRRDDWYDERRDDRYDDHHDDRRDDRYDRHNDWRDDRRDDWRDDRRGKRKGQGGRSN